MKDKNMILGVALLGLAGYLFYKHKKGASAPTSGSSSFDGTWSNCNACSNASGSEKSPNEFWTVSTGWVNERPY